MRRLLQIAVLSFGGALACALLFFAVLQRSLPPSDAAYGLPLLRALWDPFVIGAIVMCSGASGLIATLLAYFMLRDRRLLPCAVFAFVIVALEVILVTPWFGFGGWLGAYLALGAALIFCRYTRHRLFSGRSQEDSAPDGTKPDASHCPQ
jgi:hypothetical protein